MTLVLEVISEHRAALRDGPEFRFGPQGGTIGRSSANDWTLPDADRYLSGKHASIDYRSGRFYLADLSSNGVYVNHSVEPLGRGNPHRLFDGDHIRMGNFELRAHVDEGEDLEVPADSSPSVAPDQVNPLFPEDDLGTGVQLIDESEMTGDNAIAALLVDGDTDIDPDGESASFVLDDGGRKTSGVPVRRLRQSTSDDELLTRFLVAAGIDPDSLDPSVDAAAVLTNAGEVLHELIGGLTELMAARSNMKSMFRMEQTGVMPQLNNPIKLSATAADTLKQLLVGQEGEYLGPLASVREACKDLRWHQDAVIGAMIRSFTDYLERLDPEQLAEHYHETHQRKHFLISKAKRKYWEHFCDVYPVLTQAGNASLPQSLSEEFVRQYDRQLADFARVECSLGETQTIRMPESAMANPLENDERPAANDASEDDEDAAATGIDDRPRAAR